ncbi:MAG: RNA-binding transcriptional accessory protein [Saprospiraceae bacterium]|nr:RNA-binding transcriptional accessory protein [Saprospiraceae bacterium]
MEIKHLEIISLALGIQQSSVLKTVTLMNDGATIPFIARYRKEMTGSLDEVQIADIQKLYKKLIELDLRKVFIIASIEEQGKLTPELRSIIINSFDANEIEDIYLPYKRKKKTRGDVAKENGLESLAKIILGQRNQYIEEAAIKYLNDKITTIQDAIQGAQDIVAEWISEDQDIREKLRQNFRKFGVIQSKVIAKKKSEAEKYQDYFDFQELLSKCPSHRYLAIMRGENENFLKINLIIDDERALQLIDRKYIQSNGKDGDIVADAVLDSYKRLIHPSLETQIKNEFKEKADDDAIRVFGENLRQLLLAAPLGQKAVIAIDPGFRTGCKVVCLDSNGDFQEYVTIFPHGPQNQASEAKDMIKNLVYKYQIKAIGIGNGTASRETQSLVKEIAFDSKVEIYMVNESGASIYSASDVAREEFPDKDITIRGAVSIGRRLMDPLAELVKIDAKSIGVGQYQHDVHQGKLKENLEITVSSCVNKVGVNLNTASRHILTYIAGLGPSLAKNIVEYRRVNGDFKSIDQLNKVPRLGDKAYEQAAGFLRIRDAENALDNTGVHPECYHIVAQMSKKTNMSIKDFVLNSEVRKDLKLTDYVSDKIGMPTLIDIMKELDKPGLDPRGEARTFSFDDKIKSIEDVHEGMVVPGIVTNLTNFGAFVDIGVKQDGLLHISQITDKFIQTPGEVLKLQQELIVKVTGIDVSRKRINLSCLF